MFEYVNLSTLQRNSDSLQERFRGGRPFPHVQLKMLVKPDKLPELLADFPDPDWEHWSTYPSEHVHNIKANQSTTVIPSSISRFIFELNSGPFLEFLESISGIDNLLPDPHLVGGGMHLALPGGRLTPHIDYHLVDRPPHYRRLNLILYLTPDWQPEHQGYFELWNKDATKVVKSIKPTYGNCFLFQTDDNSMHGFSQPVQDNLRRSIALFYYTATEPGQYSGNQITYWQAQTLKPKNLADRLRLFRQRLTWSLSRRLARASWRFEQSATRLSRAGEPKPPAPNAQEKPGTDHG